MSTLTTTTATTTTPSRSARLVAAVRAGAAVAWRDPATTRPSVRRAPWARPASWVPAVVVIVGTMAALVQWIGDGGRTPFRVWLVVVPLVSLVLGVRRPLLGWRLLSLWQVPLALWVTWGDDSDILIVTGLWGWLPALFAAARRTEGAALGGVVAWSLAVMVGCWISPSSGGDIGTGLAFVLVPLALGWSIGAADRARARVVEEGRRADLVTESAVVLQERARIARELHDVVSHHVAVIAIRCESAPHRFPDLADDVRQEFAAIAGDARESLRELHDVLAVLRPQDSALAEGVRGAGSAGSAGRADTSTDRGGYGRAPAPGVGDLKGAVARACSAGAVVTLHLDDSAASRVSAGEGLTVYRIATQALANSFEHAPGAPVTISVSAEDDGESGRLRLVVENGPRRPAGEAHEPDDLTGGAPDDSLLRGHGIQGMRERAALHGGELTAGPTPAGGFLVAAVLPLRRWVAA